MLDTARQGGDFREQALVRGTGHDLMGVALRAGVWTDDDDGRAEEFDEMPASAGDGEDVGVGGDGAEDLEGGVVLEEEIVFDSQAADVFEHMAELHVFGVGAEAVESIHSQEMLYEILVTKTSKRERRKEERLRLMECVLSGNLRRGTKGKLTYHDHQSSTHVGSAQTPLSDTAGRNGSYSNGNTHA